MSDETKAKAPAKKEPTTVTLRVEGPAWCTTMTFPLSERRTLVIDRRGVEVPAKAAPLLIDLAAQHGVRLRSI